MSSRSSCHYFLGRSVSDLLRYFLVSWCWIFVQCSTAIRERNLRQAPDDNSPDFDLTTPEFIAKYGYPAEIHKVQSEDGYILELHRIPRGRSSNVTSNRVAVLVHHALLCSSFDWVVMGPEKALGFILADAGYDVWLANARGNTYSRKHISMDPSDPNFWEFSWDEMGTYDVPAEIDYILNTTGHKKLFYIGHSTGTTMFFVMASQRPEYNDKIQAMIAFAPVMSFSRSKSRMVHYIQSLGEGMLQGFFRFIGYQEFLPQNSVLNPLSRILCKYKVFTQRFCIDFMYLITGKSTQLDKKRLTLMLTHTPAGCSTRQVMHFAQEAVSGEFCRYDFGEEKNMEMYGQPEPPKYNISNIKAPVRLYYSDNDKLAPYYNVRKIAEVLSNLIGVYHVPFRTFNHIDFMWGKDANKLVFKDAIYVMEKYKHQKT